MHFLFFFKKKVELIHGISSKAPTQTQKFKTLQKLILSFFSNITHIISQLTDEDTLRLAITESAKLIPYIISSRKAVKLYLKVCAFPFVQNPAVPKSLWSLPEMSQFVVKWE